jgi:hypothetical protein
VPIIVGRGLAEFGSTTRRSGAEKADPGITRRTLDAQLAAGEEPTKAAFGGRGCVCGRGGHFGGPNPKTRMGAAPGRRRPKRAWAPLRGGGAGLSPRNVLFC